MFARLFAESGLSLDRLRALLAVGAAGSIVRAAEGDPVRQSQFSRQIKELEDFFQAKLVERQGKGIRLTASGKELARISRFFLLGLSNFQRGCRAEEQTFGVGASATFVEHWLVPRLVGTRSGPDRPRYVVEVAGDDEIERRLHDLTLDFGVVTRDTVSRPLQQQELSVWPIRLWVPKVLALTERDALRAFREGGLPLAWPARELAGSPSAVPGASPPALACGSFVEARIALAQQAVAAPLPEFLEPVEGQEKFYRSAKALPSLPPLRYSLVWNPRLLRLNPHAIRQRDSLVQLLSRRST